MILSAPPARADALSSPPGEEGTATACLRDILADPLIGVEYQPLVSVEDGRIEGYEALARFYTRSGAMLPPDRVFTALHSCPAALFGIEVRAKRVQIAHAPPGVPLFLNIDPDAFDAGGEDNAPLLDLLRSRTDIAVEIIENACVSDARLSLAMLRRLRTMGTRVALDDIGGGDSLVSFEVLAGVDDLKLAKDWVSRRDQPVAARLIAALAGFARDTGKRLIVEGIETEADLAWAREIGADLVQGFLFRPRFVSWRPAQVGRLPHRVPRSRRSELVPLGEWM